MRAVFMAFSCVLVITSAACDDSKRAHVAERDASTNENTFDAELPGAAADAGFYEFPCDGELEVTHAPTFEAIYREVFCVHGCAAAYCHGARGASGGMNLETFDTAYDSLVNAEADSQPNDDPGTCKGSGLRRVDKGHPERSLLFLKVSGTPSCGMPMPPRTGAWSAVDAMAIEQISDWIEAGATR